MSIHRIKMGEGRDCALAWPQNAEFSLSLFHRTSNYKEAFSMEKQRFSHQEASSLPLLRRQTISDEPLFERRRRQMGVG